MKYIIDNSVLGRTRHADVLNVLQALQVDHDLCIALPTILEVGVSARNVQEYDVTQRSLFETYEVIRMNEDIESMALSIQTALVSQGKHRGPGPVDVMVAACASAVDGVVLHYDTDFVTIEECAGVRQRWILPPGTHI